MKFLMRMLIGTAVLVISLGGFASPKVFRISFDDFLTQASNDLVSLLTEAGELPIEIEGGVNAIRLSTIRNLVLSWRHYESTAALLITRLEVDKDQLSEFVVKNEAHIENWDFIHLADLASRKLSPEAMTVLGSIALDKDESEFLARV